MRTVGKNAVRIAVQMSKEKLYNVRNMCIVVAVVDEWGAEGPRWMGARVTESPIKKTGNWTPSDPSNSNCPGTNRRARL